jgi:hypothetical protein
MDKSTFRKNQMYLKRFSPLAVANVAPLFLNLFTVIVRARTTSSLANAQDERASGADAQVESILYIKGRLTNTRHAALPVHVASAIPVEEGSP